MTVGDLTGHQRIQENDVKYLLTRRWQSVTPDPLRRHHQHGPDPRRRHRHEGEGHGSGGRTECHRYGESEARYGREAHDERGVSPSCGRDEATRWRWSREIGRSHCQGNRRDGPVRTRARHASDDGRSQASRDTPSWCLGRWCRGGGDCRGSRVSKVIGQCTRESVDDASLDAYEGYRASSNYVSPLSEGGKRAGRAHHSWRQILSIV